ncbi:MAG TPA: MerR family transcriptional regulator [Nitrospiria bacterium]
MNTFRIKHVSKLTGLSRDVIRMWERRYGFLRPERGSNRYRLYSEEDIALLRYISAQLKEGTAIGELAALGRENLLSRLEKERPTPPPPSPSLEPSVTGLLKTLEPLDSAGFEQQLNHSTAMIPFEEALWGILLPLQERVGHLWHEDRIGIDVEHFVTKQVQQKIFTAMNQLKTNENALRVAVACPPGENHEIGAQSAAYIAKLRGCEVIYLGADVPVASMADLCRRMAVRLALISLVNELDEEMVQSLAKDYAENILGHCPIWAGGREANNHKNLLEVNGIKVVGSLTDFNRKLSAWITRPE